MRITTEPRSDQWNADDFVGGPRTFTIAGVKVGSAEQKYDIELVEGEGRAWRPPLTVLRLLVAGWTDDATVWVGRRVTLYRDPTIRFGKDQVGGIRVSHMSHLDKPLREALTITRGKRSVFVVQPLPDAAPAQPPSAARPPEQPADANGEPQITTSQDRQLVKLFKAKAIPEAEWLSGISHVLGHEVSARTAMTEDEWLRVIDRLEQLPDGGVQQ